MSADRGKCSECGGEYPLRVTDGFVRRHGDCPGGGQAPLTSGVGSRLPAGGADNRESLLPTPGTAVYLVRLGKRNPELQYSLRSLAAHTSIDRVVIVGYRPPNIEPDLHIPTSQKLGERGPNMRKAFEAIVQADEVPETFILMNDDFMVMKPTEITPLHRGTLTTLLHRVRPTGYFKALRQVAELLPGDALAYEPIHTPMPFTKTGLAKALDTYGGHHGIRTLVGNFDNLGGTEAPNAKNPPEDKWDGMTFLSTSDKSFKYRPIGAYIRKRFPTPSRWET